MKRIGGTLLCNRLTNKTTKLKEDLPSFCYINQSIMNYRLSNIIHACGLAKEQLCLIDTETQTEEKNDKTIRRYPSALLHRTTHHELQIL